MKSFCIATWNLNYISPNGSLAAACQKEMAKVDADIWVLTETRTDFCPGKDFALIAKSKDPVFKENQRYVAIWAKEQRVITQQAEEQGQKLTTYV